MVLSRSRNLLSIPDSDSPSWAALAWPSPPSSSTPPGFLASLSSTQRTRPRGKGDSPNQAFAWFSPTSYRVFRFGPELALPLEIAKPVCTTLLLIAAMSFVKDVAPVTAVATVEVQKYCTCTSPVISHTHMKHGYLFRAFLAPPTLALAAAQEASLAHGSGERSAQGSPCR